MKLHIYNAGELDVCYRAINQAISGIVGKINMVQHRSMAGLLKDLGWNTWDEPVIIFTENDKELDQLLDHAEHLADYRIVLVLHDDKPATLAKGHKLRPRILFSQPVAAETIAAVIARIVNGVAGSPY